MALRLTLVLTCVIWMAYGAPAYSGSGGARRPATAKAPLPKAPAATNKPRPANKPAAAKTATPAKVAAKAPATSTAPQTTAADDNAPQAGTKSYKLRYKFKPGETLRWEVEHRAKVRSTVQGTTQAAETISTSVKNWKVDCVDAEGNAVIIHSVDHVEMTQKFDGRQDIHYSSDSDAVPPPVFENVAKAVGKPLAKLTLDPRGNVLEREEHYVQAAPQQENVTLPLPENAVTLGEEWTMPADIMVTLPDNVTKKIKARQLYRLEAVDDGIASLHLETQILTPVNDPQIESQLVQSKASGVIRFDLAAGRVVSQQSDIDEHVQGFQGAASSMHYVTRFTEKLLPDANRAAVLPRAPTSR